MNLISQARAANICSKFKNLRILVVGDIMLDHWVWGEVSRICPEAPVPVVNVSHSSYTLGGAANVAANLRALGAKVDIASVVGADDAGRRLRLLLQRLGIGMEGLFTQDNCPTILKSRIIANNQQVVRADIEQCRTPNESVFSKVADYIRDHNHEYQAVVFSDYNKGLLWNGQASRLIQLIQGVPVIAGPKPSNVNSFSGIDTITLNSSESSQATGYNTDTNEGLEKAGSRLLQDTECTNAIITLSARGMSLFRQDQPMQKVPALASQVYDVSGAGDTVLAMLALCRACGIAPDEAIRMASHAAAIVVRKVGTATVSCEELIESIDSSANANVFDSQRKILTLDEAYERVQSWRQEPHPKCVVFTNGCFYILHSGHLHTLQTARREGDALIVGLNSDASVRRLKGDTRPINPEQERAELLAAMECVDAVVIFDEDTPLQLIERLQPDVHVKGGDYSPDDLPEAKTVHSYGGKLVLAKLLPGHSTTEIVLKAKGQQA
ncbi:D-glycero-beta-D-manno-heptose 1-phosphate adenylyltransferase [bacterium]|nr:D-glycero-beta-D-manno-heptose 1-phosphate adenylyltransferase [bacterium]